MNKCLSCEARRASYPYAWTGFPPGFKDGGIYPIIIGTEAYRNREAYFTWVASLNKSKCVDCAARVKELAHAPVANL